MWNGDSISDLFDLEQDVETRLNVAVTTAPAVAPYNAPPTNPNPDQKISHARGDQGQGVARPFPDTSLTEGGESRLFGEGTTGGGKPMPWEAAFPGGGSNSVGAIVNSNTGNRHTTVPLVSIPVRGGMSMGINLYHNSVSVNNGFWGKKWSSDLDATLNQFFIGSETNALRVTIKWGDGSSIPYTRDPYSVTKFNAPAGLYHSVQVLAGNMFEVKMKDGTKYNFTGTPVSGQIRNALLVSIQDRNNNTITIQREPVSGRPLTITEPLGRKFSFGYTGGRVTGLRDCGQLLNSQSQMDNRLWTFGYSGTYSDQLSLITYPKVKLPANWTTITRSFTYSADGKANIVEEGDGRGKLWSCEYDTTNRLTKFWRPGVYTQSTIAYFPSYTTYTNSRSPVGVQRHSYTSGKIASIQDEAGHSVSGTFDSVRRQGTFTNELGRTWVYAYDTMGNVLSTTHPTSSDGQNVDYAEYGSDNTLYRSWNKAMINGSDVNKMEFLYDNGRPTSARRAFAVGIFEAWLFSAVYNGYGQMTSKTTYGAPGPSTTTFGFSNYGLPMTVTDANYKTSTVNTDDLGWVTSTVNQIGKTTTIYSDAWGRPVQIVKPGGTVSVKIEYDAEGNITKLTDERNKIHQWTYNDRGLVMSYTNAKGEVENYAYDNEDFRTSVQNGRGHYRYYTPAARGETWKLEMPDGATEFWTYTKTGNVRFYTPAMGGTITYSYDQLERPTTTVYSDGVTPGVTFNYLNLGKQSTMADGTGTTTWNTDMWGDPTSLITPQGTINYEYTGNYVGMRTKMTEVGSPNRVTNYEYDTLLRLKKLTNPESEVTEWAYDDAGRMNKRTLGNGTWEAITYDDWNRPTAINLKKPTNTTIRAQSYQYDNASNVTQHVVAGVTTNYTYDDINQLLSETKSGHAASYTYDANGNRLTKTLNGVTQSYVNDLGDKLTSITQGGSEVKSFGYDAAGRRTSMTEGGTTTNYTWDMESRIKQITKSGVTTNTFAYNGFDARTSKTDSLGTNTFKRAGAGVTSPVLADSNATYTPGISEKRGADTRYLHSGLKNADSQTDPNKAITATRDYDAFGNVLTETPTLSWKGPFGNAGGFGYQEDPDHGLKLLGHRYYDSSTGRFLSRDPAEDGRNWYTYCSNNPLNGVDPNGAVQVALAWRRVLTVQVPTGSMYGGRFGGVYEVPVYHCFIVIIDNAKGKAEPSYTFGGGRSSDERCVSIGGPWAIGVTDHDQTLAQFGPYSGGDVPAIMLVNDDTPMDPMYWRIAAWDQALHALNFNYLAIPKLPTHANSGTWGHELVRRMGWDDEYDRAMKKRRKHGHDDPVAPGWNHRPPTIRNMAGPTN
ncbi:MAG: RHS repeat-associated core domain-containing protein [Bdellovibrionia bacterium]